MDASGCHPPDAAGQSQRLARRWVLAVLAVVLAAAGVGFMRKAVSGRTAFARWQPQVRAILRGENPYATDVEFPIPPLTALVLAPLALLAPASPAAAAGLFLAIKIGLTLLAVHWTLSLAADADRRMPGWAEALAIGLSLRWLVADITHGNINLLILFGVAASLWAFRTGRMFWSAGALALGIAMKLTPALFVLYFLWKRQWRLVGLTAAVLAILVLVVPAPVFGPGRNVELLYSWYLQMVQPYLAGAPVTPVQTEHINQSFTGIFYRLLSRQPAMAREGVYIHVADWSPETVRWVLRGASLGTLVLLAWLSRWPMQPRHQHRLSLEYGLVALAMLFLSERSWKHHYVIALIAHAALVYQATRPEAPRARRAALWGALGLSYGLWTLSSELLGARFANLAEAYGVVFWGAVVLAVAAGAVLHGLDRKGASAIVLSADRPGEPDGRLGGPAPGHGQGSGGG